MRCSRKSYTENIIVSYLWTHRFIAPLRALRAELTLQNVHECWLLISFDTVGSRWVVPMWMMRDEKRFGGLKSLHKKFWKLLSCCIFAHTARIHNPDMFFFFFFSFHPMVFSSNPKKCCAFKSPLFFPALLLFFFFYSPPQFTLQETLSDKSIGRMFIRGWFLLYSCITLQWRSPSVTIKGGVTLCCSKI